MKIYEDNFKSNKNFLCTRNLLLRYSDYDLNSPFPKVNLCKVEDLSKCHETYQKVDLLAPLNWSKLLLSLFEQFGGTN